MLAKGSFLVMFWLHINFVTSFFGLINLMDIFLDVRDQCFWSSGHFRYDGICFGLIGMFITLYFNIGIFNIFWPHIGWPYGYCLTWESFLFYFWGLISSVLVKLFTKNLPVSPYVSLVRAAYTRVSQTTDKLMNLKTVLRRRTISAIRHYFHLNENVFFQK